jgi:hypothetical protein
MTHTELFHTYLHHYADKNLEAIGPMLAINRFTPSTSVVCPNIAFEM